MQIPADNAHVPQGSAAPEANVAQVFVPMDEWFSRTRTGLEGVSVTPLSKSRADGERLRHKSAVSSARRFSHCGTKRRKWTTTIAWVCLIFGFMGSALGQANLLQNGDFESGGAAWTFSGDFYYAYDYNFPNNGFGYAYLGKTSGWERLLA